MIIRLLFFLFPLLVFSQPAKVLTEWKKDPALKFAGYAFTILDATTGTIVAEHNGQTALIPASTQKIFTTAAALDLKGKQFRFETRICYEGSIDRQTGILNGDIVICGSGDPSLQSAYFGKDKITGLWAQLIAKYGIRKITGKIVANAALYDRTVPDTWLWEDVSNYFGANSCGLNYMDNRFSIVFQSGGAGSKAQIISAEPSYQCCKYELSADVTNDGMRDEAYVYGDPNSFKRHIKGSIPPMKERYEIEATLPDAALLCAEHLLSSLRFIGVECSNEPPQARYDIAPPNDESKVIYKHQSPDLEKLVFFTNQNSNNLYCEALARQLSSGTVEKALLKIKSWLVKKGLDTAQIFMKDACGLSRLNACTSHSQAQLLSWIYNNKDMFPEFNASLPLCGKQGGLANVGKGTFIEDNLRAKSGYLERARAYCGYVKTKKGKALCFSVIINNYNCSAREAKQKLEKFLVALAEL